MLKQTLTYTDFSGNQRTDDFYFNLTKGELAELEVTAHGGMGFKAAMESVIASNDGRQIIDTFKEIIRKAYGVRADDVYFHKSEEISRGFENHAAYSEFFYKMVTDADFASEFIKGVVPRELGNTQPQDHLKPQQPTEVTGYLERPPHESGAGYQAQPGSTYQPNLPPMPGN